MMIPVNSSLRPVLLFVLAASVFSSGMFAAETAPAARPAPRRFVIDSHQHYSPSPDYIRRLVDIYRPRGAMACVLTPMVGFETVRQAALQHPDVVIPYGRISVDDAAAAAQIAAFAEAGFKGIKMHAPLHDWDDPRYFPLYELILKRGMIALFHTGIASHSPAYQHTSMARMRPSYLDTLARKYPDLRLQGAHLGNPWYDEAAEAARWAPNLYFDITGSTLLKKKDDLSVFKKYLWWEGPAPHSAPTAVYAFEKLVFGTDEVPENLDAVLAQYEALLEACDVPEASRRKIYGETMAHILGIQIKGGLSQSR